MFVGMKRESNIELLRIVLLFMVILTHAMGNFMAHIEVMDAPTVMWGMMYAFTRPAVNVFVLISGYYSIEKEISGVMVLRKTARLVFRMLPVIFVLTLLVCTPPLYKVIFAFICDFITVQNGFFHFWYLVCYVILFLIAPYLNKLLNCLSKKEYFNLIVVSSLLYILLSSINDLAGFNFIYGYTYTSFTEMKSFNFIIFINLYMIGGYIKKYNVLFPKWSLALFIGIILFIVSCLTLFYSFGYTPINILRESLKNVPISHGYNFYQAFFKYNNIFIFVLSIALFLLFKEMQVRSNRIINLLGRSTSGAYILHVIILTAMYALFCKTGVYPYWNTYHDNLLNIILMSFLTFIMSLILSLVIQYVYGKMHK